MPINSDTSNLAVIAINALNGGGGGGGTVTSVSAIGNNGITANVADPTTTPQITIGLGNNVNLTGNPTTTTQSQGDNSTKIATTQYVDTGLATKAPINSPTFTGTPTAPTPLTNDNSTNLATTAYVQSNLTPINQAIANLQIVSPATVGATGAQYADLTTAYNAGVRYMECVSNFTQNQFQFAESVYIKIRNNVVITFNNALANPIRYNGTNEANLIIDTEGNGTIVWSPTSGGTLAFISASINSNYNIYINNLNFDCTGAVSTVYFINSLTNAKELYIEGNVKIKCKDNGVSGIQFTSTTFRNIQALNTNFIFIGGGANSRGMLSVNNTSLPFMNSIQLIGDFSTTQNLIDFQNSSSYIDSITFNPTVTSNCLMQLSGTVNNILNVQNSNISITIFNNNATINNANLGGGTLNVNNKTGFKGYGIYNYAVTNIVSDTFINGMNLVPSATLNNLASFDSQGQVQDSGINVISGGIAFGNPTVDGVWRLVPNGANLEVQVLVSGIWTTKGTWTPI